MGGPGLPGTSEHGDDGFPTRLGIFNQRMRGERDLPASSQREDKVAGKVLASLIVAAVFWVLYQAANRAMFGLPQWAADVLYFFFGALVAWSVYLVIAILARRARQRSFSTKTAWIIYAVVFTAIIPNFIHGTSKPPPDKKGANSTNIIAVPARGPSLYVLPISGYTKRLVVRPAGSAWVLIGRTLIDPDNYKPRASDNLRFVSRTGKAVKIYAQQFWHSPTQAELTAPMPALAQ